MTERAPLRSVFVPGIRNFVSALSGNDSVIPADRQQDKPDYPYVDFRFVLNGKHPIETIQPVDQERNTVPNNSDPSFDHDVEVVKTQRYLMTVSQRVKTAPAGSASEIALDVQRYWEGKFNDDIRADGSFPTTHFRQVEGVESSFQPLEGTRTAEKQYTIDAQLVIPLELKKIIETIESVEVASDSELLPGETFG